MGCIWPTGRGPAEKGLGSGKNSTKLKVTAIRETHERFVNTASGLTTFSGDPHSEGTATRVHQLVAHFQLARAISPCVLPLNQSWDAFEHQSGLGDSVDATPG